uniref:Uncharacterized protein n=1 Tax=Branchiostoma floridae TaxID=7739 RepID=C3YNU2_BRAFL|eukprot:XP_002602040.1 hypothetical protein BRAFLDRAFT_82629 [Branchiostoma floridae]
MADGFRIGEIDSDFREFRNLESSLLLAGPTVLSAGFVRGQGSSQPLSNDNSDVILYDPAGHLGAEAQTCTCETPVCRWTSPNWSAQVQPTVNSGQKNTASVCLVILKIIASQPGKFRQASQIYV